MPDPTLKIEEKTSAPSVPWGVKEVLWSFVGIAALSAVVVAFLLWQPEQVNVGMALYEFIYLVPVIVVLLSKHASLTVLGLRRFKPIDLLIGAGLMAAVWMFIIVHNIILMIFGIAPQGEYLTELFNGEGSLVTLVVIGVIIAPLVEEFFFRGLVFPGLREKYNWKVAAVLSALLFGLAHMQLAVLLPTVAMGLLMAYLVQRTNSVWPGVILHAAVNGLSFALLYILTVLQPYLPQKFF
jgi:membrane protease YdiL (CAAX protease family)